MLNLFQHLNKLKKDPDSIPKTSGQGDEKFKCLTGRTTDTQFFLFNSEKWNLNPKQRTTNKK